MELKDVGIVMATRTLFDVDDTRQVEIRLGVPQRFPDSPDYYVPFQVIGLGSDRVLDNIGDEIASRRLRPPTLGICT